ncbi:MULTISPECIES: prolyl oligopeptidase family serine peptidase [unclassified Modestobacter]|uniref:prolyl oligopeptidase family serine peptidase n=1 Tax=unclassified Modestobacter TaxID=2643866 RepID=UPI0022AA9D70|nr:MULTISPECIES: prolyl oligopeptidase family serine peptidase [unclassified Modestobacter]MCZ2824487.1 prolyl oligopeptidase family serine peptidase [Modestobacter sp. VKM Ac-2981]MCZ2853985.1 prolyl oligopeptidase family serine peptidase [Modestobacter sp. VKM Ac-2982]
MRYPDAPRLDLVDDLHGHPVADPYRWLEDAEDPRSVAWAAAQDELAAELLAGLPGRPAFAERMAELVHAGAVGIPVWRNGRAFSTRRDPGQEHAVLRVTEPDGSVRVLVDPTALDPAGTTTLDAWSPSWEGDRLAYQVSVGGDEESQLFLLDVGTGELVEGPIDRCRYSPVGWLPGGTELFYVRRLAPELVPAGEEQFHRRVWRHRVGTDPADDVLVHGEGSDPATYFGARTSADGRWLVVSASVGTAPRDDVWLADLAGDGVLRELQVGVDAQTSAWVARDGRLWLHTDRDAPRSRLVVADPTAPASWTPSAWQEVVPQSDDGVLGDVALVDGPDGDLRVLAVHAVDATDRLSVWAADGSGRLAQVTALPPGSVAGVSAPPEGGTTAWVGFTDYATPPSVLRWDAADPTALTPHEQAPVAGSVPDVQVVEAHATSSDGTPVHLFVLSATGTPDTPRPTVLYGYGGFNVSLTPAYSAQALAWVAAGGVWVVANLRGGSEHGEEWHRAGMRERKQNVFDDFAAAAGHLIAEGWTTPAQLAVMGGSNGGLLVGAMATQHPDLVAAVVCSAPLLDMVRYELFGLGRTWNDEYGTAADPVQLGWLLGYSPYHRVVEGTAYPAVLFTTFESDTRVDPLHARKLAAALQHATTAAAPIVLRRELSVGHGARAVSRTVGLAADQLAFLAAHTGLAPARS